ncbi:MAG: RagB/SusD family nutrient uptake outer membrane protein [Bacteroidota bacterium]|nr:RagB/SusD family nutrient uptake outer membrane protein [Bacteroidota bacterium]
MNTKKILVLTGFLFVLLSSCVKYLDPFPNGARSEADLWKRPEMVQGLIGQMYSTIAKNYDNNEGAYLDCATDNAVSTSTTRDMCKLAQGLISTASDPFRSYWDNDYKAIRLANTFLKDRRGFKTRFLIVPHLDSLVRYRLQGEAFALRAWYEWDLLMKFGGKGMNGQLLGFPIVTEPVDISKNVNLARDTYDDCIKQIVKDCDSAYKYLPIAYRDFLVKNLSSDAAYAGSLYWARIDGITTRAIKAVAYLTWASPRFNPNNDISRWDSAAVNAKKVMDFKLTVDGNGNTANPQKANAFNPITQINWVNPQFSGGIWITQYGSNDAMEKMFYPGGFQCNGTMGASQDLVDAFGMKNGYPITDPRSGYDPKNPYLNREPRFYSTIFYNNCIAGFNNTATAMYTFENWQNGGKDAPARTSNNSRTGYYIKKFVYMGLNYNSNTKDIQRHSKFLFEWGHMVLAFAEAANHVVGPTNASKYGLSAKAAIAYLRTRKTTDGQAGLPAADPYLDEVSQDQTKFDDFLKNERRITTCFEGQRFYDMRRWTTTLTELNKPVHGAVATKNADGSFTYDLTQVVENRVYKSAYLPIPYDEMLRMSKLVQNEGWDSWK